VCVTARGRECECDYSAAVLISNNSIITNMEAIRLIRLEKKIKIICHFVNRIVCHLYAWSVICCLLLLIYMLYGSLKKNTNNVVK